jgi:heme-degrading monooxygenase HmoA
MTFEEMDATTPLSNQISCSHSGPLVLVNKFTVAPEDRDALIAAWTDDATFFKQQPGFISAQLHRGLGGSNVFLNYAVWESLDRFRAAFGHPHFRDHLARYPASTVASPHLFERLAVRGICLS